VLFNVSKNNKLTHCIQCVILWVIEGLTLKIISFLVLYMSTGAIWSEWCHQTWIPCWKVWCSLQQRNNSSYRRQKGPFPEDSGESFQQTLEICFIVYKVVFSIDVPYLFKHKKFTIIITNNLCKLSFYFGVFNKGYSLKFNYQ